MRITDETVNKFYNLLKKYAWRDVNNAIADANNIIDELLEATGACDTCSGRGFVTIGNKYELCSCKRGEQLEGFVENYNLKSDTM